MLRKIIGSQRGALFGMDARLALMIFTVLTGTLGYYSYGKLKTVRQAALIKELEDIDIALRSYQADMGTFVPFTIEPPTDKQERRQDISVLWSLDHVKSNYAPLWNGPYVDFSKDDHQLYGTYGLTYMTDAQTPCRSNANCFAFIEISNVPEEVWQRVNAYFDESQGHQPEDISEAHILGKLRADKIDDPRTLWFRSVARHGEFR